MSNCYHCGEQIIGDPFKCSECNQSYCSLHKNPVNHDCNIVKELASSSPYQSRAPAQLAVPDSRAQRDMESYLQQTTLTGSGIRGTTDGTFNWYHQEVLVPENAFDPDSGIEFKGIFLSHKSELMHLLIGAVLIYALGLLSFYSQVMQFNEKLQGITVYENVIWMLFLLAGIFTAGFLFHEFGHRQVARHYDLQTKFRLLTFGMVLTLFILAWGLISLLTGVIMIPAPALPGAVVVLGLDQIDKRTGWCKSAGPLVNLILGAILLIISFFIPVELFPLNYALVAGASLNFMLGLFNMIPIGILDGQNIFRWKKSMYFILVISLGTLFAISYITMSLYINQFTIWIIEKS